MHLVSRLSPMQFLLTLVNINLSFIIIALLWGFSKGELAMKFEEYGFITNFSVLQLLSVSLLTSLVYKQRKQTIWLLISIGFVFLALDEKFLIHENLDHFIHQVFQMQETHLSDKIDDFLILAYGLIGLIMLLPHRKAFMACRPGLLLLGGGFILMVLSVVLDTLGNDSPFLSTVLSQLPANAALQLGMVLEESAKILAEAFLVSGFYAYLLYKAPSDALSTR